MTGLLSRNRIGVLTTPWPQPRGQLSLAEALSNHPVRKPARRGLGQCLTPRKQAYMLPVEMDAETKLALDRGETISIWRCQ